MKAYQDLANLISIRNFLNVSIDNIHIKLSREDVKNVQNKVQQLDKTIIDHALKIDLSKIDVETIISHSLSFESSEDTEKVMKKFSKQDLNVKGEIPVQTVESHNESSK